MEHCSLIEVNESIASSYASMAVQLPGAKLIQHGWGHRVTCDLGHPIGNYAFFMDFASWESAEEFPITSLRSFNLYLNDHDEVGPELGVFEERMTLHSLVCTSALTTRRAQFLVEEARSSENRAAVSQFIAAQFYKNSAAETRHVITNSIANSVDLSLYSISDGTNGIAGAAMLTRSTAVWGIYSVCVDPAFRGRGMGSNLVQELCRIAAVAGRNVQLQCEVSRKSWYLGIGFKAHSFLHVYCV